MLEDKITNKIKAIVGELGHPISEIEVTSADSMIDIVGRQGTKSKFYVAMTRDLDGKSREYSIKRYLPDAKTMKGRDKAKHDYFVEKSVLVSLPNKPKTYLPAVMFNDEMLMIVFPGINRHTLEKRLLHVPMIMLEEAMKPLRNYHQLASSTDLQKRIEDNLQTHSKKLFSSLEHDSTSEYFEDIKLYEGLLKGEIAISSPQKLKILRSLTNSDHLGPFSHDRYPWNLTPDYMIDAGSVKICPWTLSLGCLIGHHTIFNRIGEKGFDHLLRGYLQGLTGKEGLSPLDSFNEIKKEVLACGVYGNLRDIAWKEKKGYNKEYVKGGLDCISEQTALF